MCYWFLVSSLVCAHLVIGLNFHFILCKEIFVWGLCSLEILGGVQSLTQCQCLILGFRCIKLLYIVFHRPPPGELVGVENGNEAVDGRGRTAQY